jgi:hypothetical protein
MNAAVKGVNDKIQNRMQQIDPQRRRWRFVDPNSYDDRFVSPDYKYLDRRFCEPGRTTADAAIGANDATVNFISLGTTINEDE